MSEISCPLAENALSRPDAPAVLWGRDEISWRHLNQIVGSVAERMKRLGACPDNRIGILAKNNFEHLIMLLALWRLGCIAVLFNHRLPLSAVNTELERLECKILLSANPPVLDSSIKGLQRFSLSEIVTLNVTGSIPEKHMTFREDQPLAIIFTSGSLGQPKAAVLSAGNFYFNAKGANENMPFGQGDRWLLSLPLFHVGGLGIIWRTLLGGGSMVIASENEDTAAIILQQKITHVSLVPTQLARLMKSPEFLKASKFLKAILLGGAPIPGQLLSEAIATGLPVYCSYGLTEMASQVATTPRMTADELTDFHAPILNHREISLTEQGEILVRGKTLFLGYIQDGKISRKLDPDGWFTTGDIGALDRIGRVKIKGRRDNMFISGGENIHPEEIEGWLLKYPGIEEAIVIGLANDEFGVLPVAFLKMFPAASLSRDALIKHLSVKLPKFKIPKKFFPWPEEGSFSGLKINRQFLAQAALKCPQEILD